MIGAWILTDDQDQISGVEVIQGHGSLADTDAVDQRPSARFMAHVGAVREVVRAVHTDEELVEECGLIRSSTRGVEDGPFGVRR